MKKVALSAMLGFAMVAAAAAQTSSSTATTSGSGSSDQNNTPSATSSTSSSSDQNAGATGTTAPVSKEADRTESGKKAKMTGCVQKEGSGYALVDKKHPNGVQLLSSEDLSAHVGHKVEVKGTWEAGSMTSSTSSNLGTPENPKGVSTSNTGEGATSAKVSKPADNPYSTPIGNNTGTADMTPVGGKPVPNSGNNANASALPQSDQAAGQAIRVTEVKMKSDKCELPSGTTKQ